MPTTGVKGVGEFVKNSDGTWEVHASPRSVKQGLVSEAQVFIAQGRWDGRMDGGVSRISDEAG